MMATLQISAIVERLFLYQKYLSTQESHYLAVNKELTLKLKSIVFNSNILTLQAKLLETNDVLEQANIVARIEMALHNLISYDFDFEQTIPFSSIYNVFDNLITTLS